MSSGTDEDGEVPSSPPTTQVVSQKKNKGSEVAETQTRKLRSDWLYRRRPNDYQAEMHTKNWC